ncbi:MAG: gamma-glutamyltransferase family protein [Acidiferrobacteraceae bacterium]
MTDPALSRAIAVAPHAAASETAMGILRDGGDAIEAMIGAAATISVVYPHMAGLGGDAFWLIREPDGRVFAIDGSGPAGQNVTRDLYRSRGLERIPEHGPLGANTVAGAVASWSTALMISRTRWGSRLPLSRLLDDGISHAEHGIEVSESQARATRRRLRELALEEPFQAHFLVGKEPPAPGHRLQQRALGATLRQLVKRGLDDFYRGPLGHAIAEGLRIAGSPLTTEDLARYHATVIEPLALAHTLGTVWNVPPPTQGLLSLVLLGILDRVELASVAPESADYIHLVVEATKQAFSLRDRALGNPPDEALDPRRCLTPTFLEKLARAIRIDQAMSWQPGPGPSDTVWMGVADREGRVVSYIQSLYHEFGSGVMAGDTGILWHNRGCGLSLANGPNALLPGRKPVHTLNPALAVLANGDVLAYGSMGGDGQPQTQAALFTRVVVFGQTLEQAIEAPRWLLGRTWGQHSDTLKLEARFPESVLTSLRQRGHRIEPLAPFDEAVGHAGLILRRASGSVSGAADPRSNGIVLHHP